MTSDKMPSILIAEDESTVVEELKTCLRRLGYRFRGAAADGPKALQLVEDQKPDLVLVDIMLQNEMDGIETANIINTRYDIPVIFLINSSDIKNLERARPTYPFSYLLKPFRESHIKVTIDMVLHLAGVDRERKRAEKKLNLSELWMRSTFHAIDDAAFIVTPERFLVDINKSAIEMFGYTREELEHLSTSVLHVDEDHYRRFGELIKKAFDQGEAARFEFVARRKNGEIFPSEHTVALLKDDGGAPLGILSLVRDISKSKKAEKELENYREHLEDLIGERTAELEKTNVRLLAEVNERKKIANSLKESENNLRTLLEQSPIGVLTIDNQGTITDANPECLKLLGSPGLESTLGINLLTLPNLIESGLTRHFREVLEKAARQDIETPYTSIWGKQAFLRTRIVPRFDSSGRQIGAIVILENITDQKAFEAELRKLYQAVEQSPSTVVITDTEGRIEYVNPKFSETTGYSREEALGKNPNPSEVRGAVARSIRGIVANHLLGPGLEGRTAEPKKKTANSIGKWPAISGVRDDRGRITHYVAVKEDITTRKIAEQNLKRELDLNRATARLAEALIFLGSLDRKYHRHRPGRSHGNHVKPLWFHL